MTMIDFEAKYTALSAELAGNQKKLDVKSALGVYYGLSKDGNMRLAFMSVSPAPKIESTKMLRVTQGEESKTVYWTCFDLLQPDAKKVFFTFCENLIEAVTDIADEQKALASLKKRYITWKTMFKRDSGSTISRESLQGLYGELYFLKKYMIDKHPLDIAIPAWSGPDSKSKDFAVGDEWYEVHGAAPTPSWRCSGSCRSPRTKFPLCGSPRGWENPARQRPGRSRPPWFRRCQRICGCPTA